jgi:hypothetical protein
VVVATFDDKVAATIEQLRRGDFEAMSREIASASWRGWMPVDPARRRLTGPP